MKIIIVLSILAIIISTISFVNSVSILNHINEQNSYYDMQQKAFDNWQDEERRIGKWLDEVAVPCENCSVTIEAFY